MAGVFGGEVFKERGRLDSKIDEIEYCLNDCTEAEKELAKKYIKNAILGLLELTLDNKVDIWFNDIAGRTFLRYDEFHLNLTLTTIGNDILAAVGAGRRQLKQSGKGL